MYYQKHDMSGHICKTKAKQKVLISIHHAAQLSCASNHLINEIHVVVGWDGMLNCDVLQNYICVQNPKRIQASRVHAFIWYKSS